jgi:hypothetical protein
MVEEAAGQSPVAQTSGGRLLRGIAFETVLRFLAAYRASDRDRLGPALRDYLITEHTQDARVFSHWNIGVVEPASGPDSSRILGPFGLVRQVNRSRLGLPRADGAADIKALMSKRDVLLDVEGRTARDDWETLKAQRQASIGPFTPLLLLYAIDPQSRPQPGTTYRVPLDAVAPVLGVALVLPDRGAQRSYVQVRLNTEAAEGEDLMAALGDTP